MHHFTAETNQIQSGISGSISYHDSGWRYFDANMARTMNSNMEKRIVYNVGCDAIYNEDFRLRIQKNKDGSVSWMYDEPDFGKYESLKNEGICDGVTRVLEDERVDISAGSGSISDAYLMAINTKEFGETAKLQSDQNDDINDAHWFNYLNELAEERTESSFPQIWQKLWDSKLVTA